MTWGTFCLYSFIRVDSLNKSYILLGRLTTFLYSILAGCHVTLFSPITFIRDPLLWPRAIDKVRATHTVAPFFAVELVTKRWLQCDHPPEVDLASLTYTLLGAEPGVSS